MKNKFHGWWVTAGAFLTFGIAVGIPYYNIGFFYDYFQRTYGWSRSEITLGFPIAALLTIWAGPLLVPRFSRVREHARHVMAVLRAVGSVHDRLHFLRPDSAPDHRLELVPRETRNGHGYRLRRRWPARISGLVRR